MFLIPYVIKNPTQSLQSTQKSLLECGDPQASNRHMIDLFQLIRVWDPVQSNCFIQVLSILTPFSYRVELGQIRHLTSSLAHSVRRLLKCKLEVKLKDQNHRGARRGQCQTYLWADKLEQQIQVCNEMDYVYKPCPNPSMAI